MVLRYAGKKAVKNWTALSQGGSMSKLVAYAQLDLLQSDLNWYDEEYYDDGLIKNANIAFNGASYADRYWINGWDGEDDLQLEFLGSGFQRNAQGVFTAGTVNVMAEFDLNSNAPLWIIYDTSISATAIYAAALTPSTSDELSLLQQALSGDDAVILSPYSDRMLTYSGNDIIFGQGGNDQIDGGAGVDTAVFSGNRASYTITQNAGGYSISGTDGSDSLQNVEYARFADTSVRLYPGVGTSVNFETSSPASYMGAIRDFGGNDLGSASGWLRIGSADVNGDGDIDQIF